MSIRSSNMSTFSKLNSRKRIVLYAAIAALVANPRKQKAKKNKLRGFGDEKYSKTVRNKASTPRYIKNYEIKIESFIIGTYACQRNVSPRLWYVSTRLVLEFSRRCWIWYKWLIWSHAVGLIGENDV